MNDTSTEMISEIEAWLAEGAGAPTVQPRKSPYWCPRHSGGCSRRCSDRRWGRHGAAGVLFFHAESGRFLVNLRSKMVNHGGTWSTLGGAIDEGETPLQGAVREAHEETGTLPKSGEVIAETEYRVDGDDGSSWSYHTFVVAVPEMFEPVRSDWESEGSYWLTLQELATERLHKGFQTTLPKLVAQMYQGRAFA